MRLSDHVQENVVWWFYFNLLDLISDVTDHGGYGVYEYGTKYFRSLKHWGLGFGSQ
jgi:hypothetical protein